MSEQGEQLIIHTQVKTWAAQHSLQADWLISENNDEATLSDNMHLKSTANIHNMSPGRTLD